MKEVFTEMDPKNIESEYLNGVYNEIANLLGVECALVLHSAFRGQQKLLLTEHTRCSLKVILMSMMK